MSSPAPAPPIHLIIQYCNDKRPERAAEYDECLRRNLANPAIAAVHDLVEPQTSVPDEFRAHPKHKTHRHERWMTYSDAFAFANANLAGQAACIANLDIFLDASGSDWALAARTVAAGYVLCLSRIEWDITGHTFHDPILSQLAFATSQDAWVFQAPFEVPNADFEIGTIGCDNAIAHRIKMAGRTPVNAGSRFRIFHYDRARGKNAANAKDVHDRERQARPRRKPEEEGQYLLPDIDRWTSADQMLQAIKANEIQRYLVICEGLNRFLKLRNE
jgi:hypothetical protein